jgi:hypothetical protein
MMASLGHTGETIMAERNAIFKEFDASGDIELTSVTPSPSKKRSLA